MSSDYRDGRPRRFHLTSLLWTDKDTVEKFPDSIEGASYNRHRQLTEV